MKKIVMYTIVPLIIATTNPLEANIITTFLDHPPQEVLQSIKQDFLKNKFARKLDKLGTQDPMKQAHKNLKNQIKLNLPKLSGFVTLYKGYVNYSNRKGLIALPLKHSEPKVTLVITPSIKLKKVFGHTISHVEFFLPDHTVKTKTYVFERKKDKKKVPFWNIKEEKTPPNKKLHPDSMVLLTKPKNIVVPTGDFMTTEDPNLILPSLFVVGNFAKAQVQFDFLDIKRYFEQVSFEKKEEKEKLVTQSIIVNE